MAGAPSVTPEAMPNRLYYTQNEKRRWVNFYPAVDDTSFSKTHLNIDVWSIFVRVA
jgi:hypothetical protein